MVPDLVNEIHHANIFTNSHHGSYSALMASSMNTVQLLEHILSLHLQGLTMQDEPMLTAIAELPAKIPQILDALNKACDASASLENVMLHLGERMTDSDRTFRNLVSLDLSLALGLLASSSKPCISDGF